MPSLTGSRFGQPRDGETPADVANLGGELRLLGGLVPGRERTHDQPADLPHLIGAEPARRCGRGPDPDPRGDVGRVRVERDGVLVDRDPRFVEEALSLPAGHAERRHVHAHHVVVRPAGDEPAAAGDDLRGEDAGILHRATLVLPELGRCGQPQRDRLRGDDVHEGPTLGTGEDGLVPCLASSALCAISTRRYAPTPWAIAAKRSKSRVREYELAPAITSFGRTSAACRSTAS